MTDIIFAGAHPDDVEIGAGGTIRKLVDAGFSVHIAILTRQDDPIIGKKRTEEAIQAASVLGVEEQNVLFIGHRDGFLNADGDIVGQIRNLFRERNIDPAVVFTHSKADSHNDHKAAADIIDAVFRKKIILRFGIVNHLIVNDFHPRVFVDIDDYRISKTDSLRIHASQAGEGRIMWDTLEEYDTENGKRIGTRFAEAFEISEQLDSDLESYLNLNLNSCAFNQFWLLVLKERRLFNIHGIPVYRKKKEHNWPTDKDREGMVKLRRAFAKRWYGPYNVEELSCETINVERYMDSEDILLSGGSVSNTLTRNYFNHFDRIRYVIDYDMPDYRNIRIFDRQAGCSLFAEYEDDEFGGRTPRIDRGILTLMRNPMAADRHILGCMGIHGYGSLACYTALSEPVLLNEFMVRCPLPFPKGSLGYQIIVRIDTRTNDVGYEWDTLHILKK